MKLDTEGFMKLEGTVKGWLDQHINDRKPKEAQWIKNLRQHQGKYDPDVLAKMDPARSKAYPRDTRLKIRGYVAKMMEMMFPSQEKNWELTTSAIPSIEEADLQAIIVALQQEELVAAQQEQRQPEPLTSDQIERAVREFAEQRKDNMEELIEDQLGDEDIDYPQIAKRVVRSGGIYGLGVVRSPMVRTQQERVWEQNELGQYEAVTKKQRRPFPEYVRVWDIFPDFSAHTWRGQDRIFERMVMNRFDLSQLAKRPDFLKDKIADYLRNHQSGNYQERSFDSDLRDIAGLSNIGNLNGRRYEIFRMLGFVSAHELRSAGMEIKESELDQQILADIWMIDNTIIKAQRAAFGTRPSDQYPAFIPTEDEDSGLTGIGKPEDMRDSQMGVCAATRAMFDNMAISAGPITETNRDLLAHGSKQVGPIHAFMNIDREGEGVTAGYPAVRSIQLASHVPEIQAIIKAQREQLDMESNLPAWTFGQTGNLGEAFRTSNNMSMMTGGANMVTKDDVRAFDAFTSALIGGMLKWNMEFSDRKDVKGDFQVRAKGNLSLVAKEVRGAALDQLVSMFSSEEWAMVDRYGLLQDRLKSRDLPTDRLLPKEEAMANLQRMQEAQAAAAKIEQDNTQAKTGKLQAETEKVQTETQLMPTTAEATIREILARTEDALARAGTSRDRVQLENIKTLLETMNTGAPQQQQIVQPAPQEMTNA